MEKHVNILPNQTVEQNAHTGCAIQPVGFILSILCRRDRRCHARRSPDRSANLRAILSILVLLVAFGCSSKEKSGNFSSFLVTEIAKLGGRRQNTNALPALPASWTVQSDTNGFEIHLPNTAFADVGALLERAYGTPYRKETNWMLYRALDIGVAINFYPEKGGCAMNCVRGFGSMDEMLDKVRKK